MTIKAQANATLPYLDSLREDGQYPILAPRYFTKHIDNPYTLPSYIDKTRRLPHMLDNIGLWYIIQGIKAELPNNKELNEAITTLTKYAENRALQRQINEFRKVTMQTSEKVDAMRYVQRKVEFDSLLYAEDYHEHNDLQLLLSAIRTDSNFQWLEKVSRDSVYIDFVDNMDNPAYSMWINGNNHQYRKVWLRSMTGDTIGAWLETLPGGNRIRINVDPEMHDTRLADLVNVDKKISLQNDMDFTKYNIGINKESLKKKYWKYYTIYDMNLSQAAIKNWVGGGQNSLSVLLKFAGYANYNRNRFSWENYLKYNIGMVLYEGESPRKSDDYFEINTKLGYSAAKNWFYTFQFNLQTQLFNSYKYNGDKATLVADFMSPTYIVPSLGMNYKPNKRISLLIAPIAGKMTWIRDINQINPGNYSVAEGKHIKSSVGTNINYNHTSKTLWKFLDINSSLDAFVYYNVKDYKIPLYLNWKMTFKFRINYFMNTTLYMETKYDENSSKKIQFKENLGIGVSFRL